MKKLFLGISILAICIMIFAAVGRETVLASQDVINAAVTEETCTGYTIGADPETIFEDQQGQGSDKWYATKWVPTSVTGTGTFTWVALEPTHDVTVTVVWTKYTRTSSSDSWTNTGITSSESDTVTARRPAQCNFTFCHIAGLASDPANYITHTDVPLQQVLGHFDESGTVQAGHENDYFGACNPPTPTYCEVTTDGDTTWGDWVIATDGLSRTRTGSVATWDANDNTHSCDPRSITETQYLYCIGNGQTGWYDEGKAPDGATIGECPILPTPGSATFTIGACHWVAQKSVKDMSITIDNATFTIDSKDYTESVVIQLPSGTYDWSWTAISPYTGTDSGQITIEASCEPGEPTPVPTLPIPNTGGNIIIPVTGADRSDGLIFGLISLAGLGLVIVGALKFLIK